MSSIDVHASLISKRTAHHQAEQSVPSQSSAHSDANRSGARHRAQSSGGQPPELLDFLAVAKRRWMILLGVPLVAALLAAGYVILSPTVWTSTATVSAPALVGGEFGNQYSGSQAVDQFVAQFQAVASGPVVRNKVAETTGVSGDAITDGLTVAQRGASSVMTITYLDSKKANVEPVVTNVAAETLRELFGQQVTLGESLVTTSAAALATADAAIKDWEVKNKIVAPEDVYRAKLTQLAGLQQQAISLQANGNTAGAASAKAQAASIESDLAKFSGLLSEYRGLVVARDAAAATQVQAEQQLQNARAQQLAADPAKVVFVSGARDAGKSDDLLSKVLPITAAGIFLGVVLVAILEMLSASRRRSATAKQQSSGA